MAVGGGAYQDRGTGFTKAPLFRYWFAGMISTASFSRDRGAACTYSQQSGSCTPKTMPECRLFNFKKVVPPTLEEVTRLRSAN